MRRPGSTNPRTTSSYGADLVAPAQTRDTEVLAALIERCSAAIARGLAAAGYNRAFVDYDDVQQDALTAIVDKFPGVADLESPCGWMHTVTRNMAIARTRSKEVRRRGTERLLRQAAVEDVAQEDVYEVEDALPVEELASLVVGALPPDYQAVVVAYHLDEMPVAQIAAELFIAEDTVYTRLRRARKVMLQVLREHGHA